MMTKVVCIGIYSYFMIQFESIEIKDTKDVLVLAKRAFDQTNMDLNLQIAGALLIISLMEFVCYLAIRRWRSNIKRDIVYQFNLERLIENKGSDPKKDKKNDQHSSDNEYSPFL